MFVCIGAAFLLFASYSYSSDKGRKYYEETEQILWEVDTNEKIVALTFDDGPHYKYTPEILNLLNKYHAKATFFIVGKNAEKNPEVILRMYEEGHEIANHTYSHPTKIKTADLLEEIQMTSEVLFSMTGKIPELFRPVEGQYTDEMIDAVTKKGYKVVMWSWHLDTEDWRNPGVDIITKKVIDGVGNGKVVLFHDGGANRRQTVQALEKILANLEGQGYKFVTISELLAVKKRDENRRKTIEKNQESE
ncbi:polysaccharide deacetylase family protein [Solibacillus sp. FSL K6-1523]|uniref:polysaccharide deacetylase family protein n=1 Tax=Solibacillus sp. FSL K6-1523 TaxID=2921471 RepID=UPI0030FCDB7F